MSAAAPGLAYVDRLSAEHLRQRGPAFDGDGDAVDEPAQLRERCAVGDALERRHERAPARASASARPSSRASSPWLSS